MADERDEKIIRLEAELRAEKARHGRSIAELEMALETRRRINDEDLGKLRRVTQKGSNLVEACRAVLRNQHKDAQSLDAAIAAAVKTWDEEVKGSGLVGI